MNKPYSSKVDSAKRLAELRQGTKEPEAVEALDELEFAEKEGARAFSLVSADRNKFMLEMRWFQGNSKALSYSYLVAADFVPGEGVILDFSAYKVTIRGRNLRMLFEAIIAQRASVVHEQDELQVEAAGLPEDATVVTKIEITEVEPLEPGVKGTPAP